MSLVSHFSGERVRCQTYNISSIFCSEWTVRLVADKMKIQELVFRFFVSSSAEITTPSRQAFISAAVAVVFPGFRLCAGSTAVEVKPFHQ